MKPCGKKNTKLNDAITAIALALGAFFVAVPFGLPSISLIFVWTGVMILGACMFNYLEYQQNCTIAKLSEEIRNQSELQTELLVTILALNDLPEPDQPQ